MALNILIADHVQGVLATELAHRGLYLGHPWQLWQRVEVLPHGLDSQATRPTEAVDTRANLLGQRGGSSSPAQHWSNVPQSDVPTSMKSKCFDVKGEDLTMKGSIVGITLDCASQCLLPVLPDQPTLGTARQDLLSLCASAACSVAVPFNFVGPP